MPVFRSAAGLWALVGFSSLLLFAISRLLPHAIEGLRMPLEAPHIGLLVINIVFMGYSEGYRGFQRSFSPKFAARVAALRDNGSILQGLLAPLYCMGYFGFGRRQMLTAWGLTIAIVALVVLFRYIPQPWRGVLDIGVVIGLVYGLVATWLYTAIRWNTTEEPAS